MLEFHPSSKGLGLHTDARQTLERYTQTAASVKIWISAVFVFFVRKHSILVSFIQPNKGVDHGD